jgi:hypothetical protein
MATRCFSRFNAFNDSTNPWFAKALATAAHGDSPIIRPAFEANPSLTISAFGGTHRRKHRRRADCLKFQGFPGTQITSSPAGTCAVRRNVLISEPSPQTIISGNRLNHRLSGTSGSVASQCASSPIAELKFRVVELA